MRVQSFLLRRILGTLQGFVINGWCVVWVIFEHRADLPVEQIQCSLNNALLKWRVTRFAQRTAQGERNPQCARWLHANCVLTHQANARCQQSVAFQKIAERANSARAVGSDRRQEYRIDFVLFQHASYLGRAGFISLR